VKKVTDVTKAPESEAVRELRMALGESQQAFAYRMKTAIRTIARYETVRPPKGKALAEFYRLATETGHPKLANVFTRALQAELGPLQTLTHLGTAAFAVLPGLRQEIADVAEGLRAAPSTPEIEAAIAKLDAITTKMVKKFRVYFPVEAGQ
jgi:transcriptional regulator with XRE-family HTH domain